MHYILRELRLDLFVNNQISVLLDGKKRVEELLVVYVEVRLPFLPSFL